MIAPNRHSALGVAFAAIAAATAPAGVRAGEAKDDLSAYDCTRAEDDSTASGDQLRSEGYEIATKARFGDVNLMMVNPKKAGAIANCFKRQKSQN